MYYTQGNATKFYILSINIYGCAPVESDEGLCSESLITHLSFGSEAIDSCWLTALNYSYYLGWSQILFFLEENLVLLFSWTKHWTFLSGYALSKSLDELCLMDFTSADVNRCNNPMVINVTAYTYALISHT